MGPFFTQTLFDGHFITFAAVDDVCQGKHSQKKFSAANFDDPARFLIQYPRNEWKIRKKSDTSFEICDCFCVPCLTLIMFWGPLSCQYPYH